MLSFDYIYHSCLYFENLKKLAEDLFLDEVKEEKLEEN